MMTRTVYAPGVFDMFHYGHLMFLKSAGALGDRLIVGVQDDRSVLDQKGIVPTIPVFERMELIRHLEFVDDVVSYRETDQGDLLGYLGIDIFATNPDYGTQPHDDGPARTIAYCDENHIAVQRIPTTRGVSSSLLRERAARFWLERTGAKSSGRNPAMLTRGADPKEAAARTEHECNAILAAVGANASSLSLLELGCGTGRLLKRLTEQFSSVTGVDASPSMIQAAQENLGTDTEDCQLVCAQAEDFDDGKQRDVVLLAGVLPYLDDLAAEALLRTVTERLVRRDGCVLIREPLATGGSPVMVYNQYSRDLGQLYSAYYRTPDQVREMLIRQGYEQRESQVLEQHHTDTGLCLLKFTAGEDYHGS